MAGLGLVAVVGIMLVLRILQGAFQTAFQKPFSLGALVAFLVTLGGQPIAGIGAPFWGLVFGVAASAMLERPDFSAAPASQAPQRSSGR